MPQYFWPLGLVVLSNTFYHIFAKSTPQNANPYASLVATYLTSAVFCVILFYITGPQKGFLSSLRDLNWTSIALGAAIIGLELGYLLAYRYGANVSTGPLMSYIALSVLLIPIGIFLYRETVSVKQLLGILLCLVGLVLTH